MKLKTRARAGFTLIELLVVVVIIGILASVGVKGYAAAQDKARNTSMMSNVRTVLLGIENWKTDHNSIPSVLVGDKEQVGVASLAGSEGNFSTPYVPGFHLPKSPWSSAPQVTNGDWVNVSFADENSVAPPPVKDYFVQGLQKVTATDGTISDGGETVIGTVNSTDGKSAEKRSDYGYLYYAGETAGGRYVICGVGKGTGANAGHPYVVAAKSNF